jgi:hypothetical protein
VAEAAGDGARIDAVADQLGGVVVTEHLEVGADAEALSYTGEAPRHRVGMVRAAVGGRAEDLDADQGIDADLGQGALAAGA